jgi:hypothetical protein
VALIGGAYGISESGTRRAKEAFSYDGVGYSAHGYRCHSGPEPSPTESNFDIGLDLFSFTFAYSF